MELLQEYLQLNYITWSEMLVRVGLACLFGMIFGLERSSKNKPINFRAYMIVSMTSCIVAILGLELGSELANTQTASNLDIGKIISGTLTGIGFLGAGAIMRLDNDRVVGTATGASIWAAGGIGLTLGFGYYALAVTAFFTVAIILIIGGLLMTHSDKMVDDNIKHDK